MPRWILCLTHLSRLNRVKEYARARMRFAYRAQSNYAATSSANTPQRQCLETLEPRLLFSGDVFSYAMTGLDPLKSALGEQAVVKFLPEDSFKGDKLFSQRPQVDFDDRVDRAVTESGSGTILFVLDDLGGLGAHRSMSLFERELYGVGSDRLSASLSMDSGQGLSLSYSLVEPGKTRTELGSVAFRKADLRRAKEGGPVFGVSWSESYVRFYVDGQVAATTAAGQTVMDAGRSVLTTARPAHAPLQKAGGPLLGTTLSFGAALSDDQVASLSNTLAEQMRALGVPDIGSLADLQRPAVAMSFTSAGTLITELRTGETTPTQFSETVDLTGMNTLTVGYSDLSFFHSGGGQEFDAFELALIDSQGNPAVPTIGPGRDAFFNITDGIDAQGDPQQLAPVLAEGAGHDAAQGVVGLDVSGLSGDYTLVARMIGNDSEAADPQDYSRVTVSLSGPGHHVLWGIDEDDATIFAVWDVDDPVSTYIDFGQLHVMDNGTPTALGGRIEAIAIDDAGQAFIISNQAVDSIAGPVLLRVDTTALDPSQPVVVDEIIGRVPVPAVTTNTDGITGLDFDSTGTLYATYRSTANASHLLELGLAGSPGSYSLGPNVSNVLLEARPADSKILQAQDASFSSTPPTLWQTHNDESASGGAYIEIQPGNNDLTGSGIAANGIAVFPFTPQQSGDHYLWGRIKAPTGGDDSFWVSVDNGSTFVPWNNNAPRTEWGWTTVHDSSTSGAPRVVMQGLQAGLPYYVIVAYREDGAQLDQLMVTTDSGYDPSASTIEAAEDLAFYFDQALDQEVLVISDAQTGKLYKVDKTDGRVLGEFDSETFGHGEAIAFDPATGKVLVSDNGANNARLIGDAGAPNSNAFRFDFFGRTDVEGTDFHTTANPMPQRQTFILADEDDGELGVAWNTNHPATAHSSLGLLMIEDSPGTYLPLAGIEPAAIDADGVAYFIHNGAVGGYSGTKLLKLDLTQAADDAVQIVEYVGNIPINTLGLVPGTASQGLAIHPVTGDLYAVVDLGDSSSDVDHLVILDKADASIVQDIGPITDQVGTQVSTFSQAIAFNEDGTELYVSDIHDNHLYTVDPTDAGVTAVYDNAPFNGLPVLSGRRINAMEFDRVTGDLLGTEQVGTEVLDLNPGNGGNSVLFDLPAAITDSEGLAQFPHRPPIGSGAALTPPPITGPHDTIDPDPVGPRYSAIAPDRMSDVTTRFDLELLHTSANQKTGEHFVGVRITKRPGRDVRDQLALAIDGPDFVAVDLINHDGVLPLIPGVAAGGLRYIEIGHLLNRDSDGFFEPDQQTGELTLRFRYSDDGQSDFTLRERFDYSLSLLGALNQAPAFTTNPYAEPQNQAYPVITDPTAYAGDPAAGKVLEVVAGNTLIYTPGVLDPEGDDTHLRLLTGPAADLVDGTLSWTTAALDIGTHTFRLRATDEHGRYDPAHDQVVDVRVVPAIGNRPPMFTTDPVEVATAGQPYTYDADAMDPDGDVVTYGFDPDLTDVDDLGGDFQVDPATGEVSWTPTVGTNMTLSQNSLVASKDGYVGQGYMMYSAESVYTRFDGGVYVFNADHFITVIHENGQWYYFNDNTQVAFEPRGTDVLVAAIAFNGEDDANPGLNTITSLEGTSGVVHGIASGYADGGLGFYAGQVNGQVNAGSPGEFDVLGTFFVPNVASIVGQDFRVHLTAQDSHGEQTSQPYVITVEAPANNAPIFTQLPATHYVIPGTPPTDLNANETINITLANGESFEGTGTVQIPGTSSGLYTPPVTAVPGELVVDNVVDTTVLLNALIGNGTPGVTFGDLELDRPQSSNEIHGSTGIFVNQSDVYGLGAYGIVLSTGNTEDYATTIGEFIPYGGVSEESINGNYQGYYYDENGNGIFDGSDIYQNAYPFGRLDIELDSDIRDDYFVVISGEKDYNDATKIDVPVTIQEDGVVLYFNLAIGSEEWEEFVNDEFIDAFGIFTQEFDANGNLIGTPENIALLPATAPPADHITVEKQLYSAFDPSLEPGGNDLGDLPININHPQFERVPGTQLNGVLVSQDESTPTPVITFETESLDAGDYQLSFVIADTGDFTLDTTVFISSLGSVDPRAVDVELRDRSSSGLLTVDQAPQFRTSPGGFASFDFTITGDGEAHAVTLDFVNPETNQVYGSIPVLINVGYRSQAIAIDPDDDIVRYAFVDSAGHQTLTQHGATIDPATGEIAWDPTTTGKHTFTVSATDTWGASTSETYDVVVDTSNAGNDDPVIHSTAPGEAKVGRGFAYQVQASDEDGDKLRYFLAGSDVPAGMSIDADTGLIQWTPQNGQATESDGQPFAFNVLVADGHGGLATESVSLNVEALDIEGNTAPDILSTPSRTVVSGEAYRYDVVASDVDGDGLTYSLSDGPANMVIDAVTGRLAWQPGDADLGDQRIAVRVTDARGLSRLQVYTLRVVSNNVAPVITSRPYGTARVGDQDPSTPGVVDPYTYQVTAADDNGDTLRFTLADGPTGMTIDADGLLTWTPTSAGDFFVQVLVEDGRGGRGLQAFYLPVENGNAGPSLELADLGLVFLEEPWEVQVFAVDPDGPLSLDSFMLSPDAVEAGIEVAQEDGDYFLRWTPTATGTVTATLTVTDAEGASATASLTLPVNVSPVVNQQPGLDNLPLGPAVAGREWSFVPRVSDPDGDDVVVSLVDSPSWLAEGATADGAFRVVGTPTAGGPATFTLRLQDLDENQTPINAPVDLTFELPVLDNAPPFILAGPTSVNLPKDSPWDAVFEVIDPNNDIVLVELLNNPSANPATFSASNGTAFSTDPANPTTVTMTFTPDTLDEQRLLVRMTDSAGNAVVHEIDVHVYDASAPNQAPDFSLIARTAIAVGQKFIARIQATDPENDALTYGLIDESGNTVTELTANPAGGRNTPVGMRIDPASGLISWTPTAGDVTADPSSPYEYVVAVTDGTTQVTNANDIATLSVYNLFTNGRPVIDDADTAFVRTAGDPTELVYQPRATDPDDDPLVWKIVEGPDTVSIDAQTGKVVWRPTGDEGNLTERLVITASDPYGEFDEQAIDLISTSTVRHAPQIISTPSGSTETGIGRKWVYVIEAKDLDNQPLSFALEGALAGQSSSIVSLEDVAGSDTIKVLTWYDPDDPTDPLAPQFDANGELRFSVVVTDPDGLTARQDITLTRDTSSASREIAITSVPSFTVLGGESYLYQVSATGSIGGYSYDLTATDVTDPANPIDLTAVLDWQIDANGLIDWEGAGTHATEDYIGKQIEVMVTATGSQGGKAFQRFVLNVADPAGNDAPFIQAADGLSTSGTDPLEFDVVATDADGDTLTYKLVDPLSQLPTDVVPASGAQGEVRIDTQGRVTWTPEPGETARNVTVRVFDEHGAWGERVFSLTSVSPTDDAPVVALRVQDTSPRPGQALVFDVQAADDDQLIDLFVELTNTTLFGASGLKIPVGTDGLAYYVLDDDAGLDGEIIIARATARDNANQSATTAGVAIAVTDVASVINETIIEVTTPAYGATIDAITEIKGRVSDSDGLTSLVVTLIPESDAIAGNPVIELFRDDDGTVTDIGVSAPEAIATINPLIVPDGVYTLRIEASDGSTTTTRDMPVTLATQGVKLGNLALSFGDMVAPVAGVPLTVSRSYDSLNTGTLGDFGYGWSMDLLKGEMTLDAEIDERDDRRDIHGSRSALRAGSQIALTLPGGQTMNFTAVPQAYIPVDGAPYGAGYFGQTGILAVAFRPDTPDSLGAKLEFVGGNGTLDAKLDDPGSYGFSPYETVEIRTAQVLVDSQTGEFRLATAGASDRLSPPLDLVGESIDLQLTTRDNTVYRFDSQTGELRSVTDAYGNQLAIQGDDIVSSDAEGETGRLDIRRDTMGRVTRVTNALGFRVRYEYDPGTGDLIKVRQDIDPPQTEGDNTNRQRVTILKYDTDAQFNGESGQAHFLRRVMLDNGTVLSDIDYENGMVKNTSSPDGPQQSVTYDQANNKQTTTTSFGDSGNNIQDVATYDAHGNVVTMKRGAVQWNYAYDDPRFPNRVTSQADPYGRTTTFEYDDLGQLVKTTGHDNVVTTFDYNAIGQLIRTTNEDTGRSEYRDYNYAGDLIKVYDDTGHVYFENRIDGRGRLLSETDESGTTTYVYDETGRYPTTTILPDGETITAEYDPLGQLDAFTSDGERSTIGLDGFGRTTQATYDIDGDDPLVVDYGYDADPNAAGDDGLAADWTTIESESTGTITRKLSPTGQLMGWVGEDGTETTYQYDNGRLFREIVTAPDGSGGTTEVSKKKYEYNDQGKVEKVTNELTGVYTETGYDLLGRVISTTVTDPATGMSYTTNTTHEQDPAAYAPGPLTMSDSLNAYTVLNYYLPNDPSNPAGAGTGRTVTEQTQRLLVDPNDPNAYLTRTTRVEYNAAGMPVAFVNADGSRRLIEYRNSDVLGDAEQSPTRIVDEAGRDRLFTYLPDGRLDTASDLAGNLLNLGYDADDRLQAVTLPTVVGPGGDQLTVTYGYDEEDRVNQVSRPGLGTTTTHRFGIAGDPELVELPNGDLVRYTYNTGPNASPTINNGALLKREVIAGAQLTTVDGDTVIDSNNPGTTVESYSYTYALDGQIKTVTNDLDQSVTTYTYEYELPGATGRRMTTRLAEVELGNGTRVEYFYNAMGQVTELSTYASPSDNVGFTTEYDYDASGRLIEVTDPSSGVTSYTYDLAGRLSTRLLPNGIKTTWSFDARDRVVSLEHADTGSVSGTPGIVASYTYWYTADGTPSPTSGDEPRRITMHDGSYVEYDYDEALRLTQERYYNSSAVLTQSIQYDYDQAGNRTSRTVDGAVQTYAGESSSAYKLDKVTDAGGATLRDYTTDNAGRVTQIDGDTLTYNASGQLTGYGGTSYAYDAQGQRVGTTTGGSTTHYAVAPSAQNLGLDLGLRYLSTDGTLSNSVGYIYAGENPIARHTPSGTQYYLEDATDSVRALTNGTGAVSESYDYDGFGNVRSVAQPELGYHAAWHDPTSGLIDMRLREYDPQTGRFTSPDPVAPDPTIYESFNPYAFANQNPMVFSDPTGGYTLTEINISKGISKALRGVRQAGIQHARETIKDAAVDASLNFLISSISGVAPGINNALSLSGTSSQVGSKFTEQIQNLFSTDGPLSSLADYVRFEVPLSHINGNPTGSGFGAQDSADSRESILNLRDSDNNITRHKPIRPDIIWGPPEILGDLHNILGDGITSSKTYVITEIKLQYSTLRRAAKPSNNQFKGIKLFTYNHTPTQKVASFLVLFTGGGNDDLKKRNIEKKITKNYGMHAIVTALLNIQSPF